MTGKELLKSIRSRRMELSALQDSVLEIETRLTRISPILSDMPKAAGSNDKMSDGISKLIEIKETLDRKIDETAGYELTAMEMIGKLEDPIYRTILYRMYILNESLQKVADNINYTYNYTCSLHGCALNKIDDIETS